MINTNHFYRLKSGKIKKSIFKWKFLTYVKRNKLAMMKKSWLINWRLIIKLMTPPMQINRYRIL